MDQLLSGENTTADPSSQLPNLTSSINDMLAPLIWLSAAFTVVFIVLYISSMFRRRKLENALFDIQKSVNEMNERDKARTAPAAPTVQPPVHSDRETMIARIDEQQQAL